MSYEEYIKFNIEHNKKLNEYSIIYEQARELEKSGNILQAINLYEKLILSNLYLFGAHHRLAVIYRKEKDFEFELRVILKAIEQATYHWNDSIDKLQEFADSPISEWSNIVNQQHRVKQLTRWVGRLAKLLALESRNLEKREKEEA